MVLNSNFKKMIYYIFATCEAQLIEYKLMRFKVAFEEERDLEELVAILKEIMRCGFRWLIFNLRKSSYKFKIRYVLI